MVWRSSFIMKKPVSVCIITYNEEHNIRRCLESVKWANEIMVIDSRSTDKTVEICREYTNKIILQDFPGNIEQKNYAIDQAKYDWVFCIDADEEVSQQLQHEIMGVLEDDHLKKVGFYVPRKTEYLGEWVTFGRWYPDYKLRLFDHRYGRWGGENPHDRVEINGPTSRLKGDLLHRTYRDLTHHLQVINKYTSIAAGQKYAKGIRFPLIRGFFSSLFYFFDSFFIKRGVFHGARGLILSTIGSYYVFLKYAKLWELYNSSTRQKNKTP